MNNDNRQVIYCEDGEYRVFCCIWDNIKSQTHINNIHKRENSINFISTLTEPKQ